MTITYTKLNRIPKRDAYLLSKFGDDPKALLEELKNHAVKESFDHRTASDSELKERFRTIRSYSNGVLRDFQYDDRRFFPSLAGAPVGFIVGENTVEVVLRQDVAARTWQVKNPEAVWEYHSVVLPSELFYNNVSRITAYTRKTVRAQRDDQQRKELLAQEAERKRLIEEKRKVEGQIALAERNIKASEEKLIVLIERQKALAAK